MHTDYHSKFDKAYKAMPQIFTSDQFGKYARSLGVPSHYTLWAISRYLLKRCGRMSHKTWNKKAPALPVSIMNQGESEYDKEYREVMFKTLEQMPMMFGSKQFISCCVSNGVPRPVFERTDLCADFLKENTERITYRTWKKVQGKSELELMREAANKMKFTVTHEPIPQHHQPEPMTVESCIEFLKSKGYKIMKPVSEWVEI